MPSKLPETAKVMDVTHPKNVQPSASSRPVLVPSRSMIAADPMIAQSAVDVLTKGGSEKSAGDSTQSAERPQDLVVGHDAKTIVPSAPIVPTDTTVEAQGSVVTETKADEANEVDETAGVPTVDSATEKIQATSSIVITEPAETNRAVEAARTADASNKPAEVTTPPESISREYEMAESEIDDTTDEDIGPEKTTEQKQAENIEKLIDSRLYAAPIGRRAKRRARIVLLILSTVLLVLIALNLLLDMGIITISGVPHTTFFSV